MSSRDPPLSRPRNIRTFPARHNRCYDGGEHAEAYVRTLQVFNRRLTDVELMTVMRNRAAEYVTTVTSSTATQTTQTFTTNTFGPHNNRLIQEHDADITNNTGLIEAQISTTNAMEVRRHLRVHPTRGAPCPKHMHPVLDPVMSPLAATAPA